MCKDVAKLGRPTSVQNHLLQRDNRAITSMVLSALLVHVVLMAGFFCYHLVAGVWGIWTELLLRYFSHLPY